jgi:hypothetical protein
MHFSFSEFLCGICGSIVSVVTRLWAGQPRTCGLILVTNRLAVGSTQHPIQWEWGIVGGGSFSSSKAAGV